MVSAGGKNLAIPVRIIPADLVQGTLSNAAPALGDTLTITAAAPFKFTPTSVASAPGGPIVTLGINADSSQLTFIPGPSIGGAVSVTNTRVSYAPTIGPFTITSTAALATPGITSVAATYSPATPARGDTVTITLPAGFKFVAGANATFGGAAGFNAGATADSSGFRVIPPPGYTGAPQLSGVALAFLLSAPISVPSSNALTVGAPLAGTDDPATAPILTLAASGQSITVYDAGAPFAGTLVSADRIYRINVAAPTAVSVNMDWTNTADVDILFVNGAQTGFLSCFGGATGARPENAPCTLPAGDTYLVANLYGGTAPSMIRIVITTN